MPEPTNRRGFLRAFVRSAGEAFVEATEAVRVGLEDAEATMSSGLEPAPAAPAPPAPAPPLIPATPATRTLTVEELLELAAEEGLADRGPALRDLARAGTRLTPAAGFGRARTWVGRAEETAHADGRIAAVADIDRADPALAAGPLAGEGRLIVQVDVPRRAPIAPCSRAAVRVAPDPRVEARPVELSTELMLPRVWAAPVAALMLDEREQAAYIRLRERVAELQGVPVEDGDADGVAHHQLLGYPTETTGTMPLECELASRDLDHDTPAYEVPTEVLAAAGRWRLLLQVTQDEADGVVLGAGAARLYFWIAQDRLDEQDFAEVWAIAR